MPTGARASCRSLARWLREAAQLLGFSEFWFCSLWIEPYCSADPASCEAFLAAHGRCRSRVVPIGEVAVLAVTLGMAWAGPPVAIMRPAVVDPAEHAPPCPPGRCAWLVRDEALCGAAQSPAATVVLSGHSGPPGVLGRSPEEVAELLACLEPELLVLDTCYGVSAPLLGALLDAGLAPLVVSSGQRALHPRVPEEHTGRPGLLHEAAQGGR